MYADQNPLPSSRGLGREAYAYRLFNALRRKKDFDAFLSRIIDPAPDWTIDQSDNGNFYLKFRYGDQYHSADGAGEGLVSLFVIADGLYDSVPGSLIAIDEPELSLHPALQRNLQAVFKELSADRQIVVSTHSPYFIDFDSLSVGGQVARVRRDAEGSRIFSISQASRTNVVGLLKNVNNPHVLGLDAREVLFLDDRIILVEGQEDAIIYPMIASQIAQKPLGSFYGWGIGGADNMATVSGLLRDLGFEKVYGILDRNKADGIAALQRDFPAYHFASIPADDVRSKRAQQAKQAVEGIADSAGKLKEEFRAAAEGLFKSVSDYFNKE